MDRLNIKNIFLFLALSFFLSACNNKSESDTLSPSIGVFIDSPVTGMGYSSKSFSGKTNDKGEFKYLPNEDIKFFIGDIVLGSSKGAPVITPLSLVPEATNAFDNKVINIVRLLMSLDEDLNPDNGIKISNTTTDSAKGQSIDLKSINLNADPGLIKFIDKLSVTVELVDSSTAQSHFSQTASNQSRWGSMVWGSGRWQGPSHWGSMIWGSDKWQPESTDL
jgi:hypothetical protein